MKPMDLSRENDVDGAITVTSTSRHSSKATPFDLKEKTDRMHVYFKPEIVDNQKVPTNRVEGSVLEV